MISVSHNTVLRNPVTAWVVLNALAVMSGWLLSLAGQVNRVGYGLILLLVCAVAFCRGRGMVRAAVSGAWHQGKAFLRRCRRNRLAAVYALMIAAATIGGALYPPNNYDFLTYRFSRILYWWSEGSWHWVHTVNERINYSGANMEWMMMPLWIVLRTDRLFFMLNMISFLLLPGLIFSIYRGFGMGRKTCLCWMWILPAASCFATAAGGVGTDLYGAVLALASLALVLHAGRGSFAALCLALVAAGLATGVKASNLLFLLPVGVAALGHGVWRLARGRLKSFLMAALVAISVSLVPVAVLNSRHAGDWTGDPGNMTGMKGANPPVVLLGNILQAGLDCLAPPFFPWAQEWNRRSDGLLPECLSFCLKRDFPRFQLRLREIHEEGGLGLGVTMLLLLTAWSGVIHFTRQGKRGLPKGRWNGVAPVIVTASWVAAAGVASLLASESVPRLLAPYYVPCAAALIMMSEAGNLPCKPGWRGGTIFVTLSTLLVVVATPSRPLWPAETLLGMLQQGRPGCGLVTRARDVYSAYADRSDVLHALRESLPDTVSVVGFVQSGDDPDVSLWRPFGKRRVIHVALADLADGEALRRQGIGAVVARGSILRKRCGSVTQWMEIVNGRLLSQIRLTIKLQEGPDDWVAVALDGGGR